MNKRSHEKNNAGSYLVIPPGFRFARARGWMSSDRYMWQWMISVRSHAHPNPSRPGGAEQLGAALPRVSRGASLFPRFTRGYHLIIPPGFQFALTRGWMSSETRSLHVAMDDLG